MTIDIGNTTTGFGYFDNPFSDKLEFIKTFLTSELKSNHNTMKELTNKINNKFLSVLVSSVVPNIDSLIKSLFKKSQITFLNSQMDNIIHIDDSCKNTIGSDRVANMAGAYSLYKTNLAVVDFGTATTISVVNKKGDFIGSCIMPGLDLMLESLKKRTSKLPLLKKEDKFNYPSIDTDSAIKSGVIIGTTGAVERILKDIEKVNHFRLKLVLTGGGAGIVSNYLRRQFEVKPYLIFEGLRVIYLRNYNERIA